MDTGKGGASAMDLRIARLCLDCEEIFEGKSRCPRCGSETWYPIMGWIRPMSEAEIRVVRKKDIFVLAKPAQSEQFAGTAL
jgi:hypothetical protein